MLKRTTNYVETHHKNHSNSPRNTIQKPEQNLNHKQKNLTFTLKNFFQTHTNPLPARKQ
jgi:hypothetical protein